MRDGKEALAGGRTETKPEESTGLGSGDEDEGNADAELPEWDGGDDTKLRSSQVPNFLIQDRNVAMVIVGSDVVALFPSLKKENVTEVAYEAVLEANIRWEGIDYLEGARYIALTQTEAECRMSSLNRVLPYRRGTRGTRPGVTGAGPKGKSRGDCEQWIFPRVELTQKEKDDIVATVVKIAVKQMFETHIYSFGGKRYKQTGGGPIGLRSTCAVARVAMSAWDKKWLARLGVANILLEMACRYEVHG